MQIARSVEGKTEIIDENGKHPLAFKYTFGGDTTFYLSEWNGNDEVFGYTVLNGDTQMSEWGYSSLSEIRDLSVKTQNGLPVGSEMTFYGLEPTIEKMVASDYPELAAAMGVEKKSRETEMIQEFSRELNKALAAKNLAPTTENIALASYHVLQSMGSGKRKEIKNHPEELSLLAQYEGGGGLKEQDATSAETLNAFYTPRNIVQAVWKIADFYAPDAVSVLEPSSGIGRFAEDRPKNKFTLRELDPIAARIA